MKRSSEGQVIIGAIILLLVMALLVPAIIVYIQNESRWTVKQQRSTRAFQLAEAAVERGFQTIIQSTGNWNTLQGGGTLANYDFDNTYTDLPGGEYEIAIAQGPGTQTVTITGAARDTSTNEIRAVRGVFSNSASNAAIFAEGGITLTSNPGVEWGPVMAPAPITTTHNHPRFYSSGSVSLDANGATPPNSDNTQWWSYYPNLPPPPEVDTQAYLSSATAQGHVFAAGTYKMKDDVCGGASSCVGTYYFTGDTTLKTPAAYVSDGNIVVMGNLTLQGSAGDGAYTADLPPNAWKEYGNDWADYIADYDGGAPASFPGVNGTYAPAGLTFGIDKVLVHGFIYVKDSFSITGGGNMSVHGSMYLGDPSSMDGSNVKIYYDNSVTVLTKNVSLGRTSWEEVGGCAWSGAHPVCP